MVLSRYNKLNYGLILTWVSSIIYILSLGLPVIDVQFTLYNNAPPFGTKTSTFYWTIFHTIDNASQSENGFLAEGVGEIVLAMLVISVLMSLFSTMYYHTNNPKFSIALLSVLLSIAPIYLVFKQSTAPPLGGFNTLQSYTLFGDIIQLS